MNETIRKVQKNCNQWMLALPIQRIREQRVELGDLIHIEETDSHQLVVTILTGFSKVDHGPLTSP